MKKKKKKAEEVGASAKRVASITWSRRDQVGRCARHLEGSEDAKHPMRIKKRK